MLDYLFFLQIRAHSEKKVTNNDLKVSSVVTSMNK